MGTPVGWRSCLERVAACYTGCRLGTGIAAAAGGAYRAVASATAPFSTVRLAAATGAVFHGACSCWV